MTTEHPHTRDGQCVAADGMDCQDVSHNASISEMNAGGVSLSDAEQDAIAPIWSTRELFDAVGQIVAARLAEQRSQIARQIENECPHETGARYDLCKPCAHAVRIVRAGGES